MAVWLALTCFGVAPASAAENDSARLLTGLSAEVGPDGVALTWTVDEVRAHLIAGFSCVYRTPGHLRTGVAGALPCGPDNSPPTDRKRVVAGLPEYGDYDFELVALAPGTVIPWPRRALRVRVAVTEALAGAGRAVTGAGPVVENCAPADGEYARPWRLDQVVSAAHLTHFPGRGWAPGGDPDAAPEWPEPASVTQLITAAGVDEARLREGLAGDPRALAAEMMAGPAFDPTFGRAGAGTKALLRPAPGGGHELKLHSSYPFGAVYAFAESHAVRGWGADGHAVAWPRLATRSECPPRKHPDATHDVTLALADAGGGGRRLAHAGYGWWTVAPVGLMPERLLAAQAGLSFGAPSAGAPEAGARWRGRVSGHLFWRQQRWGLAGDIQLVLAGADGAPRLSGRIEQVTLVALDMQNLEPAGGPARRGPALALDGGAPGGGGDMAWSGPLVVAAAPSGERPDQLAAAGGFPAPDAWRGDWRAAPYGPAADEIAGRLRLWTPLAAAADPLVDWPSQAVLVAGFGARRADR